MKQQLQFRVTEENDLGKKTYKIWQRSRTTLLHKFYTDHIGWTEWGLLAASYKTPDEAIRDTQLLTEYYNTLKPEGKLIHQSEVCEY